ncbi:tRNA (guanosine(46)-N7)-methyltransferase TrmB [Rhodococcus marinonascens]|uniref:tRNA (guanosine(46)-N7)-methyltransferase TrmB n=1 Tax=Rhodococcus marinonascens TaxID=38311 RepID=UPI000A9D10B6|nr:tRNA (guanosine(46)-N7)-methyltransferase TrmB [Rhodococcus marinonascens]
MPESALMRDNGPVNHADQDIPAGPEGGQTKDAKRSRLHPRVTSFRSRRGALTAAQQASWDRQWPTIGADVSDNRLDPNAWFGRDAPLILEIGSGTGTATAAMAQAEPHVNLIAVEVYRPGLAQLLQQIERDQIPNIRVLRGDAMDVLENMIEPESLTGVRVFFPDPWPKARHHKRRLLQSPTFALIASRLKTGGVLHIATDHAEYAEAIAEAGNAEPLLTSLDWESPMTHERPVTKFEDKAHRVGSAITELIWGKIRS